MRYDNLQDAMRAIRPAKPRRARFKSDEHERWHRRVEGQIRDCMNMHPRWFQGVTESDRANFTRSLAKRIVGEVIAEMKNDKSADGYRITVSLTPAPGGDAGGERSRVPWFLWLWRSIGGRG